MFFASLVVPDKNDNVSWSDHDSANQKKAKKIPERNNPPMNLPRKLRRRTYVYFQTPLRG